MAKQFRVMRKSLEDKMDRARQPRVERSSCRDGLFLRSCRLRKSNLTTDPHGALRLHPTQQSRDHILLG